MALEKGGGVGFGRSTNMFIHGYPVRTNNITK